MADQVGVRKVNRNVTRSIPLEEGVQTVQLLHATPYDIILPISAIKAAAYCGDIIAEISWQKYLESTTSFTGSLSMNEIKATYRGYIIRSCVDTSEAPEFISGKYHAFFRRRPVQ